MIAIILFAIISSFAFAIFFIHKTIRSKKIKLLFTLFSLSILFTAAIIFYLEYEPTGARSPQDFLKREHLSLSADYKILDYKFATTRGLYYQFYILKIADEDKNSIMRQIKSSKDFALNDTAKPIEISQSYQEKTIVQNYETKNALIRKKYIVDERNSNIFYVITVVPLLNQLILQQTNANQDPTGIISEDSIFHYN